MPCPASVVPAPTIRRFTPSCSSRWSLRYTSALLIALVHVFPFASARGVTPGSVWAVAHPPGQVAGK
eukprot:5242189-Pyramimonas_sp.AAC.1